MTAVPVPATARLDAVLAACVTSLVVGLTCQLCWRWLSIRAIGVPPDLASVAYPALLLNTVVPALGNGLGYLLAYRRRSRRSPVLFVGPAVLLAGVGLALSLAEVPESAGFEALAVTVVAGVITPTIAVTVLLARGRRDIGRVHRPPPTRSDHVVLDSPP